VVPESLETVESQIIGPIRATEDANQRHDVTSL
jgi:hypothetical protein